MTDGLRPDPTSLTTDALQRAVDQVEQYTDLRIQIVQADIDAINKASAVLHEEVTRTPTAIDTAISHLRELTDQSFDSRDKAAAKLESNVNTTLASQAALFDTVTSTLRDQIVSLQRAQERAEGEDKGSDLTVGRIYGGLAAAVALITIMVFLASLLTTTATVPGP